MNGHVLRLLKGKPRWTKNEENWHGAKALGSGGQGCAVLFVKVDPKSQMIVDRVVVKETYDMVGLPNKYSSTEPLEFYMSRRLSKKTNTVNIFAYRLNPGRDSYRMYMEYCALGDLTDKLEQPYRSRGLAFPEPYLWKLFLDLAQACEDMDNPVGEGLHKDSFIAHVDFKPENVFMCPPDKDNFPKYPIAKLGDFGGAMLSHPHERWLTHRDKTNRCFRTNGSVAPEVYRLGLDNGDPHEIPRRHRAPGLKLPRDPRVTTTTNVWNAGLIIGELMFREPLEAPKNHVVPPHKEDIWYYTARDEWIEKFNLCKDDNVSMPQYSARLKNLVMACLDYFPENRPTPAKLVELVKAAVNHHPIMSTADCLKPNLYNGRYDLDRSIRLIDEYPVHRSKNQDGDYDMADGASISFPSSYSAEAGAGESGSDEETGPEADFAAVDAMLGMIVQGFKQLWRNF
ncbi:kinase-like protein [Aureobasidium pullulans]|uniref:non-specific serine/threonine protein kinase n=1 Tax=Aureobasidium pullulans TaxID=5580 RepID=A0A4S8XA40_AURPU|nr:kinase-like protein [Aureobasidium pullulans]THX30077.1 kinase-like protein [Aureobasidium pullulans]THX62275.1 kinase-like protein [Aureobasidium pullulans]THY40105.1 kinase-like protein [Aureobasidium pullulans]THY51399.1 kinase-like protein [Aureobasidium pullulans]